ncbi:hypothetical protein CDL12_10190 [Handroanthus impetiginosus]|uniref:Uncharacterized protein n=1 Tax=Handroanthus impetiginosus TaxID=429701 RepID=A0A2G9HI18_9LAMI|nr:hypothetical protein CDL12_10190 [Handroanthus impetiginosus]
MLISAVNTISGLHSSLLHSPRRAMICTSFSSSVSSASFLLRVPGKPNFMVKRLSCFADASKSDPNPEANPKLKPRGKTRPPKSKGPENESENSEKPFPAMIPKKRRRGRRSEAAAVEDYVRDSLGRTFESIRKQNPEILENMEKIMKEKADDRVESDGDLSDDEDDSDEDEVNTSGEKQMLVEEDDPDWPLDADVGWGIRASEYFEQHPIKNVVGEDGKEIDWTCYDHFRASDNWKVLKELEKAAEVYWKAKDRLPPRTVKVDINIERDLAYALKVKDGPQILFLRGNKILYREKDIRTANELVQMIAYFYYNSKKPSFIYDAALYSPNRWR